MRAVAGIIERKTWGGGETNVKLKRLGEIYTRRDNSVHVLCHLLSLNSQRGGKKIWEGAPTF